MESKLIFMYDDESRWFVEYSKHLWQETANKYNIDFIFSSERQSDHPHFGKWEYFRIPGIERYNKILTVDSDTLPNPSCFDVFDVADFSKGVTIVGTRNSGNIRRIVNLSKKLKVDWWDFYQGGFFITKGVDFAKKIVEYHRGKDEEDFILNKIIIEENIPHSYLSPAYNYCRCNELWPFINNLDTINAMKVAHFGGPNKELIKDLYDIWIKEV